MIWKMYVLKDVIEIDIYNKLCKLKCIFLIMSIYLLDNKFLIFFFGIF